MFCRLYLKYFNRILLNVSIKWTSVYLSPNAPLLHFSFYTEVVTDVSEYLNNGLMCTFWTSLVWKPAAAAVCLFLRLCNVEVCA